MSLAIAKEAWVQKRYLDCGRAIYEPLRPDERVTWATELLKFGMQHCPSLAPLERVATLAGTVEDRPLAHDAFGEIRAVTLAAERGGENFDPRLKSLLYLAENTAKVIYNASSEPAPFDHDAGWWIVPCFQHFLDRVAQSSVTEAGIDLLFSTYRARA